MAASDILKNNVKDKLARGAATARAKQIKDIKL